MLKIYLTAWMIIFYAVICLAQDIKIEINTKYGSIIAVLYPDKAPITCENFIKYIKNNKFEGANFYRVVRLNNQPDNTIKIEVIQGGLGFDVEESPYPPIKHETTLETGLLHKNGTLSMARAKPGTASSEFFICIGNQPELDFGGERNPDGQGFAAFGKVVRGMDIVKKIQQMKDERQMLINPVEIKCIGFLK
ncbi:MAG TPA: peptidylprolyl isomerase [Bacteroidales bacterium]|nr:peptidylprolyl isomerase [Bacteroidales bacterium]